MIRFLVALELPQKSREKLQRITYRLSSHIPEVKWMKPSKYHIALKLFRTTPLAGKFIDLALQKKLSKYPSFPIKFTQLSVLVENETRLILEIEREEMIMRLYHKVDNCLIEQGIKRDKKAFYPHLNYGLIKNKSMLEVPQVFPSRMKFPSFTAATVSIFMTRSKSHQVPYKRFASYSLG